MFLNNRYKWIVKKTFSVTHSRLFFKQKEKEKWKDISNSFHQSTKNTLTQSEVSNAHAVVVPQTWKFSEKDANVKKQPPEVFYKKGASSRQLYWKRTGVSLWIFPDFKNIIFTEHL